MADLRGEVRKILCEYPEHNRTDEVDHVLDLIMGAISRHGGEAGE